MKKIISIILLCAFFTSCKKEQNKTCNQDMAGISGTYKITAVTYKASTSAADQDYYTQFFTDACQRDDLFVLNANGTFTLMDAGVKCSPAGDDTGTWNVDGNTGNINGSVITIQSFDCSSMVIVWPDYFVMGDQIKLHFTRQ